MRNCIKWVSLIIGVLLISSVALWGATGKCMRDGLEPTADGTKAYAIVLGAKVNGETPSLALKYRLDAALNYANEHPNVQLILSGGQGTGEAISEAQAMENYVVANGLSKDRLLLENKSTSTYENILFSKALLPEGVAEVTIISNDFHLARAQKLASKLDLTTDVIAAQTPGIVEQKLRTRERLALIKTLVVGE